MKLDKIILPDFLLADLYKDSLVLIDNEIQVAKNLNEKKTRKSGEGVMPASPNEADTKITGNKLLAFLGNNEKNISIIVNDATAIHLEDELLQILSAILAACKLNLADVAIINMHTQEVNNISLRKELKPSVVLLFGVATATIGLPFSIPDYKVQQFDNCAYVQASGLAKMTGSATDAKMEKSKLWLCLKDIFKV